MFRGRSQQRYEFIAPQPQIERGGGAITFFGSAIWFCAIMIRLSLPEAADWSLAEKLFEAGSFVVFAAVPVFGLSTRLGEQLAKRFLLPMQGLGFQGLLCLLMAAYLALGKSLTLSSKHFPWLNQISNLAFSNAVSHHFVLNAVFFLGGLFIALRLPFIVLALRQDPGILDQRWLRKHPQLVVLLTLNLFYLCVIHPAVGVGHSSVISLEGLGVGMVYIGICIGLAHRSWRRPYGLMPFDFGLMVLCAALIYWVSTPSFSFGVFIAVDAFILVLVYGTGLGRSHFGYSFRMGRADWKLLGQMVVVALIVLAPLALVSGFVQPQRADVSLSKLSSYFVLFTLRVGLFEEVFFRAGIMVFLRDQLLRIAPNRLLHLKVIWLSALGSSVIFGLVHAGNSAAGSTLAPWQYKGLYIGLATVASMFYALTFAGSNRLGSAILIHGFIDTAAVVLLGGFLAVPF